MADAQFSRHTNEQHRWTESTIAALRSLNETARHSRMTHAEYLDRREAIFTQRRRLTADRIALCRGYERALSDSRWRELHHCWRIAGRPETACSLKWDDMPEWLQQACREGNAESTHCWDTEGRFPYSPWAPIGSATQAM